MRHALSPHWLQEAPAATQVASTRHQQHGTQPQQDSLYWEHMKLSALLHDLGKLLSLHNEPPTNVDSGNWFLCEPSAGVGYNSPSIIQQFNHDEFGYFKIRRHVPFRVAMIMRFHSSANLHIATQFALVGNRWMCRGAQASGHDLADQAGLLHILSPWYCYSLIWMIAWQFLTFWHILSAETTV